MPTLLSADFISGLSDGLASVANDFGAAMLVALQEPIVRFQAAVATVLEAGQNAGSYRGPGQALVGGVRLANALRGQGDTHQEYLESFRRDGARVGFFGGAGEFRDRAEMLRRSADEKLERPIADLMNVLSASIEEARELAAEGFVDSSGFRARLAALRDELLNEVAGAAAESGPARERVTVSPEDVADAISGPGGILSFAADQLARIGGFVGGTGPSVDYARRTAEEGAKQTDLLRQIVAQQRMPRGEGAAWAQ